MTWIFDNERTGPNSGCQVRRAGLSLLTGAFIDLMCKIEGNPRLVDIPGRWNAVKNIEKKFIEPSCPTTKYLENSQVFLL